MTSGIYSLVSGMSARWQKQDSHSTNISGASAIGQKRLMTTFSSFQKALQDAQQPSSGTSFQSPSVSAQTPAFDWSPGRMKLTGESLDVAIQGPGFFQVQTPNGTSLTRDGHFKLDSSNRLVTSQGHPVLGESGPITFSSRDVNIKSDGTLTAKGQNAGRLKLVMPERLNQLKSEDGTYFSSGAAKLVRASSATLAPNYLEESNVDLPREMVGMIQNQRMSDMLSRAVQAQDESYGKAIQELGSI
ncbi:MAG: flagellar hook basal-body protein [Planctomycetota bacterium]